MRRRPQAARKLARQDALEGLSGLARFKAGRRVDADHAKQVRLHTLTIDQQFIYDAEEEELKKVGALEKVLYKTYISPLKRSFLQGTGSTIGVQLNYVVYFLALLWVLFCSYMILAFGVLSNRCNQCGRDEATGECANPPTEAADDASFNPGRTGVEPMCLTDNVDGGCPDALCGTGDQFVARWIETVLMSLLSSFLVSPLLSVSFKSAALPAIARFALRRKTPRGQPDFATPRRARAGELKQAAKDAEKKKIREEAIAEREAEKKRRERRKRRAPRKHTIVVESEGGVDLTQEELDAPAARSGSSRTTCPTSRSTCCSPSSTRARPSRPRPRPPSCPPSRSSPPRRPTAAPRTRSCRPRSRRSASPTRSPRWSARPRSTRARSRTSRSSRSPSGRAPRRPRARAGHARRRGGRRRARAGPRAAAARAAAARARLPELPPPAGDVLESSGKLDLAILEAVPVRVRRAKAAAARRTHARTASTRPRRRARPNGWGPLRDDALAVPVRRAHQPRVPQRAPARRLRRVPRLLGGRARQARRRARQARGRAARRAARQYKLCSTDEAFCALGESGGVVHEAVEKLRNAAYREEMRTAADACNVSQYIKTRRKRRKPKVEQADCGGGGQAARRGRARLLVAPMGGGMGGRDGSGRWYSECGNRDLREPSPRSCA